MVKSLRICWTCLKRLVLIGTIALMVLAFWLHGGERSLEFAKPWLLKAVNSDDAPYVIGIGEVTIDWTNAATLGKMRIRSVMFAKRDGNVFAQLPEIYATVDPIGFLPTRRLLHKVILHAPHMSVARNAQGDVELGFEDSPSRLPLADLLAFFANDKEKNTAPPTPPTLPFHELIIDNAALTFSDEKSGVKITSEPVDLGIRRRRSTFEALVMMPFTMDDHPVKLRASLTALPQKDAHKLTVQMVQMPARLVCMFDACPEKVDAVGEVDGTVSVDIAPDMTLHGFHAAAMTPKLTFTAPQWFVEPLKLTDSNVVVDGDWSKQQIGLTQSKLVLEDSAITASGNAHHETDGWYVTGRGEAGRLEVNKIYKYWPIFLAPDSRAWVTSKLKSGYASKGTITINFIPTDITGTGVRDEAVDAMAYAHEVGFEYLPGFPPVDTMDGVAHFTGKTVRVEGGNGSMMSGTTITKAMLWCPQLDNPKNPMETEITATAPAADAATILGLKYFTFDDAFGLDPKTVKGNVDAVMKLKFDAFSGSTHDADPNFINLGAVTYDIAAKLKNVAQDKLYGGEYNARAMNGDLKATNSGLGFDGTIAVGDAGTHSIKLVQNDGKPLTLAVKGVAGADAKTVTSNDFNLAYTGGDVPVISVSGKKLDLSAPFGSATGTSLLADFPAMKLDVDLEALQLSAAGSFTDVTGTMYCTKAKCESAQFTAKAGKDTIKGGISTNAGQRQFLMTAGDAGAMLKDFDITDRMTKGAFDLRGAYDDRKTPTQLNARLLITNFTLQNSQILGRILSIGSLTGLQNALTGSGISFDKLSANITSNSGIITVDKGIATGTALGITTAGSIDTTSTKLNLRGVVSPAYVLNSILSKIPIIGAIAGGEQGLIAFNYSVKGTYENPDVGVNPLSGLTPGFLRGIFNGFSDGSSNDSKPPEPKTKTKKQPGEVISNPVSGVVKR